MPTTSDNKLDLLYKKFIGIPLSNPSGAAASEAAGSSKSKIIPSLQIFSQSIPSTAPSDLISATFTPANPGGGTKQISSGNIHIAKYTQLGLAEVQPQISYRYANPSVSTNLTSPAIPGNYDVAGSTYAITLYGNDGTTVINPSTYPWVFDTDSGYVSFIDPANLLPTALAPPKITFWRYEGTFGLGSSNGSSSGAVTGDLSSNGNLFIAYDTSLNSRLVVGSDVTVKKRLFTVGDASFGGNLYVAGDITTQTQSISDNSTKVATTAFVKNVLDSSLNLKASIDSPTFTGIATIPTANITILNTLGDASLNGNVTIGKDLTINGRLNVQNYTNQNIINTTTTNYQLIVSEDLSLNGRLQVLGDVSFNGNLMAGNISVLNYFTTLGNLYAGSESQLAGNVVIGKDLTINGRLNVQANTIPANAIIGGVSSSSSPGDFTANGNLTVTGNITGNLNAVSDGNVDSINFWTLTKYMNSLINAPPAVTFGNVDMLSTMIRIPWTYPTQYNIGLTDTLIPLIKSLTVTYTITKSGGSTQTGTILNALTSNSYIKSSLTDTYPITGIVLLKSAGTNGYNSNYTFTDGNRNAYVFTDSNIQGLTTGDALTLNVLYTNNNTSTNTASKPSLNFVAAGSPSAPIYRSSTPSTTSVTITIGNPAYGDDINTGTNTTITTYSVNYSSTSNTTRYGGVKSSGLITANTPVSVTPTGTANVSANTTNSITANIYPETTYTANITAVNNVNTSVGAYSGNFTFTTTPFPIPSTAWLYSGNGASASTLSFTGLQPFVTGYYNTTSSVNTLLLNLSSTYTTSSMTTIINDFERRGVNGNGNTTTISANVVLNGTVTTGPSVSLDANVGNSSVPGNNAANSITITPTAIADNYSGNVIGYDGYYKKYTGTLSLASGLFVASPYQYTVNLSRTSGNVSANATSSYSFYYDTITGNPGTPSISSFAINTTSYSPVCGINVINGNSNATFTASYSVTNLGQYFYKSTPIAYSSTGTIGTIISANESTIPSENVYGNLLIYNPVNFTSRTITSSSLTSVFTTSIPLTITASNYNGNTQNTATSISAIIDGPSVALITNFISTLSTISNVNISYSGARYYAGSSPDVITSNNNSVTDGSLFSQVSNGGSTAAPYDHTQSIISDTTYGKELQIANGYFVTKAYSYGYMDYSEMKYSSSLTNNLNYSSISNSGYRYACFSWKYTYSSAAASITFTMNSSSGFTRGNSGGFNPLKANESPIQFYYKVEDSTGGSGVTSYWINGNDTTGLSPVNSSNYRAITNLHGIPDTFTPSGSTDSNLFRVLTVNPGASYTTNTILYCIIGLPMNVNCYFKYITAAIST